MPCFRGEK
uniref:Uncharacterized protein n=1 Tax=Anguilla anguilla TaxID=7936 RepID=A0A0E9QHL9_ANGAN